MNQSRFALRALVFAMMATVVSACGGGGSGGGGGSIPTSPTSPPNGAFTLGSQSSVTLPPAGGFGGTIALPSGTGSGTIATSLNAPNGAPVLQSVFSKKTHVASTNTPFLYITVTATTAVTFNAVPGFSLTVPSSMTGSAYIAILNNNVWTTVEGPVAISNGTVTFASASGGATLQAGASAYFALYQGGVIPTPTPQASPTIGPNPQAYVCPTSGAAPQAIAASSSTVSRFMARSTGASRSYVDGLYEVAYSTGSASHVQAQLSSRLASLGATAAQRYNDPINQREIQVVHIDSSQRTNALAALRALPNVTAVTQVARAFPQAVNQRYLGTEPYFDGAQIPNKPASVPPYYQTPTTAGQWDMHAVGLDYAFEYSQANNGSSVAAAPGALGSPSIKLAIIDTGEDLSLRDLQGINGTPKVVHTGCFVTNLTGVQSTGTFVTDADGHGTDTAGIATASSNDAYAFVGDGGNVSLMAYRVFPTPDDTCVTGNLGDSQCGAAYTDISSAITDAVTYGANVISISLGGGPCPDDPTELAAINNALAHNVIVVAASGNESSSSPDAPGCDPGVIAAGASALDDGQPNGTTHVGGTATAPVEYVASYSNYDKTNLANWGIVAPGGDPLNNKDADYLHWIENAWTSTPLDANFAGACNLDQFGETGNCRTLIAGTSMATPHVAGAIALILSASGGTYQSPAAMKTLLCSTADNINDTHQGCGRLNVYRAMAKALGDPTLP